MNPWFGVAIMATVTHLMRAVPLLAIRRRITNQWMLSFLHHLPYVVLSAMAFPAVLTDAPSSTTGLVALGVALVLGWRGHDLSRVVLGPPWPSAWPRPFSSCVRRGPVRRSARAGPDASFRSSRSCPATPRSIGDRGWCSRRVCLGRASDFPRGGCPLGGRSC